MKTETSEYDKEMLNFRLHIRRNRSSNENFEYSYPLSGLKILLHDVISLPDATSYDKNAFMIVKI